MSESLLDVGRLRGALRERRFGHLLVYGDRIDSTNERALELLDRGFPEGTLVVAEEQTQGRGRRGRTWASPARLGIYATLLLRPALEAARVPLIAFAASVGLARALEEAAGTKVEIKWPNDLVLHGRKLAGLLAEARTYEERPAVVVGLGINVNMAREDLPEEFRDQATSLLLATGRKWDRSLLLERLLERWEEEHFRLLRDGGSEILLRWKERSWLREGTLVRAELGDEVLRGIFRGLEPGGEMRLEVEEGAIRQLAFGEVRRVRGEE